MNVQTVDRVTKIPHDFSFFKHGVTGELVADFINPASNKKDPYIKFLDGHIIFVTSLEKAGALIVPVEQ